MERRYYLLQRMLLCSSVDHLTAVLENKFLGEELPIDAPQLMGTLIKMHDIDELKKMGAEFKELGKSLIHKSVLNKELSAID